MKLPKLIAVTSAITIIAFAIAITPVQLHFDFDPKYPRQLLVPEIKKIQAHANPAAVSGSMNFITACAAEAGLTPAQFVASTVAMSTIASGYDITKGAGVSMANTVGNSIDNLIDAADYPAYDSLSDSEKQEWGSKQNYDAAKYNSLLNAFGMGEDRSSFFGSGGGNLDNPAEYDGWSQVGRDRLAQIGRIGNLWLNGARAKFGDILSLFDGNTEEIVNWIGAEQVITKDLTEEPFYNSNLVSIINVNYGSSYRYQRGSIYLNVVTSRDVYFYCGNDTRNYVATYFFSKEPFLYAVNYSNTPPTPTNSSIARTENGHNFYICSGSQRDAPNANIYGNARVTETNSNIYTRTYDSKIAESILFGETNVTGGGEKIDDYPEDPIPDDENIYFPTTGITPNITYNQFITPTRQNNVYNPENQTGGEDWRDETESNVLPLMNIQFDKLFPFCMLFDIQKLFDKVTAVTGNSGTQETYMTISIPLDVPGFSQGETLDLNLQWLHDLLITVRPFVQILLAAGLLFVTIRFWQGVLTG